MKSRTSWKRGHFGNLVDRLGSGPTELPKPSARDRRHMVAGWLRATVEQPDGRQRTKRPRDTILARRSFGGFMPYRMNGSGGRGLSCSPHAGAR